MVGRIRKTWAGGWERAGVDKRTEEFKVKKTNMLGKYPQDGIVNSKLLVHPTTSHPHSLSPEHPTDYLPFLGISCEGFLRRFSIYSSLSFHPFPPISSIFLPVSFPPSFYLYFLAAILSFAGQFCNCTSQNHVKCVPTFGSASKTINLQEQMPT